MSEPRLNLRVVQGPLQPHENEVIIREYNRLTSQQIPMQDFLHWIQNSPAGPSWHAIFETDQGQIVGHTSLIPLRGHFKGRWLVPAKSEYGFILEEFRTAKIRGFENMPRPRPIIMIDQLFQKCRSIGWGPFLISGSRALERFGPRAQCYRVGFPLWECLLILRPWNAATKTANLNRWRKLLLGLVGVPQSIAWSAAAALQGRDGIRPLLTRSSPASPGADACLSFFEDEESLRWRYLEGQYERLALDARGEEYVIVKKGSPDGYLRVCQWNLNLDSQLNLSLITRLVRMAREEKAIGVRWAVYGSHEMANQHARRLRSFGFITARRMRTLLVQSKEEEFLAPENWNLTDAMFCFDF